MEKNWLIRTKSNHILGPVSKDKVLELYNNGSIKGDDEVCSGNGYWFFIRESEMVDRFLFSDEIQGFNPISEAKDVLSSSPGTSGVGAEITLVGGNNFRENTGPGEVSPEAIGEKLPPSKSTEAELSEKKKKVHRPIANSEKARPPKKKLRRQPYLQYLVYLGFIVLILLIYFRKSILRQLFSGPAGFSRIELISSAHAQASPSLRQPLLERVVSFDGVEFRPEVGLGGFKVAGHLDLGALSCDDLRNVSHQLGIILHPPEAFNEIFLLKMRSCLSFLGEEHPVRLWLDWVSENRVFKKKDLARAELLAEVVNSPFNLITDTVTKREIIEALPEIPQTTIAEKLLRAQLYLLIGNVTRANNILLSVVGKPPFENWKGYEAKPSVYHRIAVDNLEQILSKFAAHPTDRRIFELFARYFLSFYNEPQSQRLFMAKLPSLLGDRLYLEHTEKISPWFVTFLRLKNAPDPLRIQLMRSGPQDTLREQAYWFWPFFEIGPLVTEEFLVPLEKLNQEDQLWFIYLLENEVLADLWSKSTGQSSLPHRRQQLRKMLKDRNLFMLALYKLIEFGDIDESLVRATMQFFVDG